MEDGSSLSHLKNRQTADLQGSDHKPEVKTVVTESYQVNQSSLSESDSQPSLRGEPLRNSLRVTQNLPTGSGLADRVNDSYSVQSANDFSAVNVCKC